MTRNTLLLLTAAALVAGVFTLPALGQEDTENKGFMAAKGRIAFNRYCASCHGEKADGSGPVARMLKVTPTDLRMLTINNDGVFPTESILAFIDGRADVKSHGSRDMPVWGEVFQTPLVANPAAPDEAGEDRASRKVRELLLYIETIQRAPATKADTDTDTQ